MICMAVIVTSHAQTIVRNQDVTFLMEPVTVVDLDGRGISVKTVRKKNIISMRFVKLDCNVYVDSVIL